jgi:transcriptional regulator with XRE-family HTH domain
MINQEIEIIDFLRRIIERRGLTLTTIAERIGVPYSSMQRYFLKKSSMPLTVYLACCDVLDVPSDYVVRRTVMPSHKELSQALQRVIKAELLPTFIEIEPGFHKLSPANLRKAASDIVKDARTISAFVANAYNEEFEKELWGPSGLDRED